MSAPNAGVIPQTPQVSFKVLGVSPVSAVPALS